MPTLCELKSEAKTLGLRGYSTLRKHELVELLAKRKAPKEDTRKKALEAISERLKTATGKARVAKAVKKYAEEKRAKKAVTFPIQLSEEEGKKLMKMEFKYVSPKDDAVAIINKKSDITEKVLKTFRMLLKNKKLDVDTLFDLLPHDKNYIYYHPSVNQVDVWSESRN